MSQTATMRTDAAPAVDIDSIALRAATAIVALPAAGNLPGGAAQLKAKIQCAVYDALEEYRPAAPVVFVPQLPTMGGAFRVTSSHGPTAAYEMVFRFKSLDELHKADDEWTKRQVDPAWPTIVADYRALEAQCHALLDALGAETMEAALARVHQPTVTGQHQALVTNIVFRAGEMRLKFDDEVPQEFEAGDRVTIFRVAGAQS